MPKNKEIKPILLRLNNADVAAMIDEIEAKGIYKSRNELINKMLQYGAPELYNRLFDTKKYTKTVTGNSGAEIVLEQLNDIATRQRNEATAHDEIFTLLSIIEFLTTTLLNIELAKSKGEPVSSSDVENGLYSTLPAKLEKLKNSISGKI